MNEKALGVDIGGTDIKIALVSKEGKILYTTSIPHKVPSRISKVAKSLATTVKNLASDAGTLTGIGVGVAGDIDQKRGLVRFSPNLGWKNVKLKTEIEKYLPWKVIIDNDANVAAWGAYCIEFRQKYKNLLCVTLGTGIGGGLVIEGKLYRGATGSAGEIGHITYDPEGNKCACGNYGCIERFLGSRYFINEVKKRLQGEKKSLITELVKGNLENITPKIITKAAFLKDKFAIHLWEEFADRLGTVLASVVNLLNLEAIVLCGGVSRAGKFILVPLKKVIKKRAFATPANNVRIMISKLDVKLGVLGAASLLLYPTD